MAAGDYNGITKECDEGFYGGSSNLVGVSIYFSYSKQEELSVCYSM